MNCQWNPIYNRPRKPDDAPHAEAVYECGQRSKWFLCELCAGLPRFRYMRDRRKL